MKRKPLSGCFRRSQAAGLAFELTAYGSMLLCGQLVSRLLEQAIDRRWEGFYPAVGLAVLALAAALLPRFLLALWRSNACLRDTQRFREFLYLGVLEGSVTAHDQGEMEVRLNGDVSAIAQYFQQTRPKAAGGAVVILCSTLLLCAVDGRVGAIFFAMNLIQLLPILLYEGWARDIYNQTHSDEEAYCNWLLEGYNGIRTIKAYGLERWYMERFGQFSRTIISSGVRSEKAGTVENIVFNAIDSLLKYGSYVILGLFILFGGLDISKAPLLIILAGYLFSSISNVYDLHLQRFDYQEAVKRLGLRDTPKRPVGGADLLTAQNVTKAYGGKQVLQGVSLQIRPGERVLLTGDNGSGKTTLLRLLLGLDDPDSGSIQTSLSREDWAFALQEEAALTLTGQELTQALSDAGHIDSDALVRHLRGFQVDTLLDQPLRELSQGERKKLCLVAALARPSRLLVLDEPANHVDRAGLDYLTDQLRSYPGALLVCAHGRSVDLAWDRVLRVEGGLCHEAP